MAPLDKDLAGSILATAAKTSKKTADAVAKNFESRVEELEEMVNGIGKRSNEESESKTASNPTQKQQQEPRQRRGAGIFKIGGLFLLLTLFFLYFIYHFVLPTLCHNLNYQQLPVPTHHTEPIDQIQPVAMSSTEQTFIAIKPDGVQRGLIGPIISRFENRGYKLAAIKLVQPGKEHLEKHYADLKDKPFFAGLVEYMNSGPICAMVWEGRDAVKTGRVLLGATNPLASAPGTIRGDYSIDVGRNVCHGSDSVENAKKEISLWFQPQEVQSWTSALKNWVYEKN